MKEQFEYGEWVEVRDHNGEQWRVVGYVGTMPNCKGHWCFPFDQNEKNFDGIPVHWFHVRKIQKPEPEPEPLFISTQGVFTAEEAVMQLQERIEKILEELNALKTQLK